MLAVVYETFTGIERDKFRKLLLHKRKACQLAFRLLVSKQSPNSVKFKQFQGLMRYYSPRTSEHFLGVPENSHYPTIFRSKKRYTHVPPFKRIRDGFFDPRRVFEHLRCTERQMETAGTFRSLVYLSVAAFEGFLQDIEEYSHVAIFRIHRL